MPALKRRPANQRSLSLLQRLGVLLSCVLLGGVLLGWAPTASSADILLVGAQDNPSMQAFRSALSAARASDRIRFMPLSEMPAPSELPAETRLILLDPPTLAWRLRDPLGPATLALRASRVQAHQTLGENRPARISLLWSDPPAGRQLRLIQMLLPQARRIGVLYSEQSEFLLDELRQAAAPLGLQIISQPWGASADNRPLLELIRASDVLLGIDDPDLYNAKTAKNLLLSSYSRQLALFGPSAGFVRAGSLATTYSDQSDWLAVLEQLLDQSPETWPRALYPRFFKVLSNRQVARALSIDMSDDSDYTTRLVQGETP